MKTLEKTPTEEELKTLYWSRSLSASKIARLLGCTKQAVLYYMKRYNIPRRDNKLASILANTKYEKKVFNGDNCEKAYLLGFIEDSYVRKVRNLISITSSSSHSAFLELFNSLFRKYGHVSMYPTYNSRRRPRYEWKIYCLLDKSFHFLLDKEILSVNNQDFLYYLAGLIDAEGSILIYKPKKKSYVPCNITITNTDKELLSNVKNKLVSMGYRICLYMAEEMGYRRARNDIWRLLIHNKRGVLRLLQQLPLQHSEKLRKRALLLELTQGGVTRWSIAKDKVLGLRHEIRYEVEQYLKEAERKYLQRHPINSSST